MKLKLILCLAVILLSIYSYGCDNIPTNENARRDTTKFPPVENNKANTDYQPAFRGQTRTAGVKTATDYKVEKIAQKLGKPWAVVPMPDGRMLVTDKSGFMQVLTANGALVKKITGFPEVVDKGQIGMLDV